MPYSPREIAEQVRKMVAGEGVVFADLFAADGVLAYPFAPGAASGAAGPRLLRPDGPVAGAVRRPGTCPDQSPPASAATHSIRAITD